MYKKVNDAIEIDWDFDSTIHYDDYLTVSQIGNFVVMIMADGVSQSRCGRVAAVYGTKYVTEFLNKNKKALQSDLSSDEIEKLLKDSIDYAGKKLKELNDVVNSYFYVNIAKEEYTTLTETISEINNVLDVFSNNAKGLDTTITIVKEQCMKIQQKISLLLDQKFMKQFLEQIESLKNLDTQLKEKINELKKALHLYLARLEGKKFQVYHDESEHIIQEIKQLIDEIKELNIDTLSSFTQLHLSQQLMEPFEKVDITKDSFEKGESAYKDIIATIVNSRNKDRENKEELSKSITKRFLEPFFSDSASTITILLVNVKNPIRVHLLVLGDSEVRFIDSNTYEWTTVYGTAVAKGLTNYISTEKGIVGIPFMLSTSVEQKNVIIIVNTDGANLLFTPPGGAPGAPFLNKLKKLVKNKKTIKGLSSDWIDYIRNHNGSEDDISLFVLYLKNKEST